MSTIYQRHLLPGSVIGLPVGSHITCLFERWIARALLSDSEVPSLALSHYPHRTRNPVFIYRTPSLPFPIIRPLPRYHGIFLRSQLRARA
jgi:hypothetical protein